MAELRDHANRLQQENDRLRTRLEAYLGKNTRGHTHPAPPVQPSKGKEPILPSDSDPPANDKLSSGSSPLLDLLPPQNNAAERGPVPIDLSVACAARHKERLVETDNIRSWPLKISLHGMGVWLHRSSSCILLSRLHPPRTWFPLPLFGGLRTCCRPH